MSRSQVKRITLKRPKPFLPSEIVDIRGEKHEVLLLISSTEYYVRPAGPGRRLALWWRRVWHGA